MYRNTDKCGGRRRRQYPGQIARARHRRFPMTLTQAKPQDNVTLAELYPAIMMSQNQGRPRSGDR
jgi:hypothetical protein